MFSLMIILLKAWFAPAGFTRGTMPTVAPEKTLPRGLRDTLYNAKINPIATFPRYGCCSLWSKENITITFNCS